MTTKEYLSQAWHVDRMVNAKLERVRTLRDLATKASFAFTDTPSGGTRNIRRMEDVIVKLTDLEDELHNDINTLLDLKRDIVSVIGGVAEKDYRTLLELRYLCFRSWGEIAEDMRYSKDHIFTLHRKALEAANITVKGVEKQLAGMV